MAATIAFELVTPERLLFSQAAEMVTVPGTEGYLGVMAGHMPMVTSLRIGMIEVTGVPAGETRFLVHGGFAEIGPDRITVLAQDAIPMSELDLAVLDQRIRDAEQDLAAAGNEAERSAAGTALDELKLVRAIF